MSHIFLVDRTTLKLVFLLAAFFVRVIHVGVNSRILCVLYSSLFFPFCAWWTFEFVPFSSPPVVHSVVQVGKCFSRVLPGCLGLQLLILARYIKLFTKVVVSFSLLPAVQGKYILMFHIRGQQTFSVQSHVINMLGFSTKWHNQATILHESLIAFLYFSLKYVKTTLTYGLYKGRQQSRFGP